MLLLKSVISIVILSFGFLLLKAISSKMKPFFKYFFLKCRDFVCRIYRIIKVRKRADFVWRDLIKLHRKSGWHFGQFEKDKHLETTFQDEEGQVLKFHYRLTANKMIFESIILTNFNEDLTTELMILASHLNTLINFGKIRVNVKYNFVEFEYIGDLVAYMLYYGELENDISTHYNIAKDCVWAFQFLIESGDDPVFVFSEFLKYKNRDGNQS